MRNTLYLLFVLLSFRGFAQTEKDTWFRAFPITAYITDAVDSIKIVQVMLPEGVSFAEKQLGLLKGKYRDRRSDTMTIGTGRCNLIKGNYYYFTISYKQSRILPREGDLLFTMMKRTPVYHGNIVKLSAYFIGLLNVYDKPLYDRFAIFSQWTKADEDKLVAVIVEDIHFTGDYFLKQNPAMNVNIASGKFEGKPLLNTMIGCNQQDIIDFFEYMIARPNLYAGHEWKIAEIFATWLSAGAPTVIKK
ncbi:MAG: hypothetical protein IT257_09420 [Chitinophagaceae bacterium]|nr:hypothetical protein [Chitinophagaceae bacterium]